MIVYRLTFPDDKNYVGCTSDLDKRIREHKCAARTGHKYPINEALRAHSVFRKEILLECKDRESAHLAERFFIAKFDSIKNGYNMAPGGASTQGYKFTEAQKANVLRASKIATMNRPAGFYSKNAKLAWAKSRDKLCAASKARATPDKMRAMGLKGLATQRANRGTFYVKSSDGEVNKFLSAEAAANFIGVNAASVSRYIKGTRKHKKFIVWQELHNGK